MVDFQAVRDAYKSHDILNVSFIRGANNPADEMTQKSTCTRLHYLLRTGKANFVVDQWFIRSTNKTVRSCTERSAFNAKDIFSRHHTIHYDRFPVCQTQNNCS